MRAYDRDKLRQELIEVYSAYVKDPTDYKMKRKARMLHTMYGGAGNSADRVIRGSINSLVEIGWNLPSPPKPTREFAEKVLISLASGCV